MRELEGYDFTGGAQGLSMAQIRTIAESGKVWELKQGVDFEGPVDHVRGSLGSYASKHGYRSRTATRGLPAGTLVVQLLPKDAG